MRKSAFQPANYAVLVSSVNGPEPMPERACVHRRGQAQTTTLTSLVRTYLCLLPLSALVSYYFLVLDRVTVASRDQLVHAGFGWPFDWVEQDLSRYQPISYPVTIEYNVTRAWHDPIMTSFDWPIFGVNTLIVGLGVTAAFVVVIFVIKRFAQRSRRLKPAL